MGKNNIDMGVECRKTANAISRYIWKEVHFKIPKNIFEQECTSPSQELYLEDSALYDPKEYI
jgi:hypothetical protein